jgi:large repetitive protein
MKHKFLIPLLSLLSFYGFSQNVGSLNIIVKNYSEPYDICKSEPVILEVSPKVDSLTYKWYKNGQEYISGSGSITLYEGGSYSVSVQSKNLLLNSNSVFIQNCRPAIPETEKNKAQNSTLAVFPTISSVNPVICGSNTSAVLQASPVNAAYTYQWYFCTTQYGSYSILTGATSATYTTSAIGYYKVLVGDGSPPNLSSAIFVSDKPQAVITDINGNLYNDINVVNGAAQLKVALFGGGPYTFSLYNGSNTNKNYIANTSPFILTVSPNQNKYYTIGSLTNACGQGQTTGGNKVVLDPLTAFTLPAPNNLNVCAGATIDIPYLTTGTWLAERDININLLNATNNSYISTAGQYSFSQNPLQFTIPSNLALNTQLKVIVNGRIPYTNSVQSSYILNVSSVGCSPTPVVLGNPIGCGSTYLYANVYSSTETYIYQWFKDGVSIPNSNGSSYYSTQSGNYSFNIQNSSTGLNLTSLPLQVTITGQTTVISTPNPIICGNSTSAILSSNITDNSFSYQWYLYSTSNGARTIITGATSPSYTANTIGSFYLVVTNSDCSISSNIITLSSTSSATITDTNDNPNVININNGETTTLKVSLSGTGPWNFSLYDGFNSTYYTTNTSPYLIPIMPNQSRYYYVEAISNNCGLGNSNASIKVNVLPQATFTLPTPTIISVCNGTFLDIPYVTSGTWQAERQFYVNLLNSGNGFFSNYSVNSLVKNDTISAFIGTNIPLGAYKININSVLPSISGTITSSYTINVVNTNCQSPKAMILGTDNICQTSFIYAYPQGTGYSYQWFKNNIQIPNSSYSFLAAETAGNYKVIVSNVATGYASISSNFVKSGPMELINRSVYSNGDVCGANSSALLSLYYSDPNATYQWYFATSDFAYQPIAGAMSSSVSISEPGFYYVIIKKGTCEIKSNTFYSCPLMINFPSQTVCQGSNVIVQFRRNYGTQNSVFTLQLLDATNNNTIINPSLSEISINQSQFNFNLPSTISAGTYKFRIIQSNPNYTSAISAGILTVLNSTAISPPILSSSISTFSTNQYINVYASGCLGTVEWSSPNYSPSQGSSINPYISQTTTYSAVCKALSGCTSPSSTITVTYNCMDSLEPNNSASSASIINSNNYTSPDLCLDSNFNDDWFSWVYNGVPYYIRVSLSSSNAGKYKLNLSIVNGNVQIESLPSLGSPSFFHNIFLVNEAGSYIAGASSQANGFQKLTYLLANPCNFILNLNAALFNIPAGMTSVPKAININASNKISNTAIVNYRGQNAITLNPGFETQITTSGIFKAQIKGCNDNTD